VTPLGSVGGRLALALLTVVAGVLAIVYLIVVPSYERSLENAELRSLATAMQRIVVKNYPADQNERQQFASEMAPLTNARVVVFDQISQHGPLEPVADSTLDQSSASIEHDPVARAALDAPTIARGTVERDDQRYAEVAYPVQSSVILLSAPLHAELQTVAVVRRRVFIAGAIATGFAILVGYGGASLFARRLRRLEAAAERIAAGYFDEPVIDHGEDEVGQLARTFERMRLRIASLDRARGEFIANASHELRTPLFSLGGYLELLEEPGLDTETREEFLAQMREQVERLTKLATELLDLSRLDAGRLTVAWETVDLTSLAAELAAEFGPRAAGSGHLLEVAEGPPVEARGDVERILQIGRVLIENALVHTPAGTRVSLRTAIDGGRAALTVGNDGPEIPQAAQRQVFERFFRLDGTRASGSGLGLAIARELAEVMDGRIELESTAAETSFTLVLRSDAQDPPPKNVKTMQTVS
jgi:signal transduction histidine kinase